MTKHSERATSSRLRLLRLMEEKVDPALLSFLTRQGIDFLEQVGTSTPPPAAGAAESRWQDRVIEDLIPEGASVLDLGCGSGVLLERLMREKGIRGQGVELDPAEVLRSVERGVPVMQADLDEGLSGFPDDSFDYVVLEETLQTLKRPDAVLGEIRRIGRRGIVTFPNFGCWRVRLDLAVRGRMPVTEWLPNRWYNTPNIHLFSLRDFLEHAEELKLGVAEVHVRVGGEVRSFRPGDNLYAEETLVMFEPAQPSVVF